MVDGNDAIEMYEESVKAVRKARSGGGPTLIECKTYRWRGHHEGDPDQGGRYRTKEEIAEWKKKDPIRNLSGKMIGEGVASETQLADIEKEILGEIEGAVKFANESPFPSVGELYEDVYVEEKGAAR